MSLCRGKEAETHASTTLHAAESRRVRGLLLGKMMRIAAGCLISAGCGLLAAVEQRVGKYAAEAAEEAASATGGAVQRITT